MKPKKPLPIDALIAALEAEDFAGVKSVRLNRNAQPITRGGGTEPKGRDVRLGPRSWATCSQEEFNRQFNPKEI